MDKIKEIEKEIEDVNKRMTSNLRETEMVVLRRRAVQEKIQSFEPQMSSLQQRRQDSFGLGENVDRISQEIRKLRDEREELEDAVKGVSKRLNELETERVELKAKKIELQKEIIVEKVRPLIPQYNECAEKLSLIVANLWELLRGLGGPGDHGRAVCTSSSGGALTQIPKLYLPKEYDQKTAEDFFRFKN